MRDPIGDVPPGYAVHRVDRCWLIFDREAAADLVRLRLAEPEVRRAVFTNAPRRGRGLAPSVRVAPDLSMVLRRYRHGGVLARLTGSLFLGPGRALRELEVTARAEASGAPVPHVVCLLVWPVLGPFWSAAIGTREERNATDLYETLRVATCARDRAALARQVGAAIAKLHDAGVEHRDLQLRNILKVEVDGPRIVVIDLDRAVFHRHGWVPSGRRAANLGRLARSAFKSGVWGTPLTRRDLAAFARGYTGRSRDLRRQLRGWLPRERVKLALHRLGYRFRGA